MIEIFYYSCISEQTNWFVDFINSIDFQNLQNVILGLFTILIPILIDIFSKLRSAENGLILKEEIKLEKWRMILFFAILALIALSIGADLYSFELKILLYIFVFSIIFCLLHLISILFKFIYSSKFLTGFELFFRILENKKIPFENKIKIWREKIWGQELDKENEQKFLKLFFEELDKQYNKLDSTKNKKYSYKEKDFINLINSYVFNKNIKFLGDIQKDEISGIKSQNILNMSYSHELLENVIKFYLKKNNVIVDVQLFESYNRIIETIFCRKNVLRSFIFSSIIKFIQENKLDNDSSSNNSQEEFKQEKLKIKKLIKGFFMILFNLKNDKFIDFLTSIHGSSFIKSIKENIFIKEGEENEINKTIFTEIVNFLIGDEQDTGKKLKSKTRIFVQEIFKDCNEKYIYMLIHFIKDSYKLPENIISMSHSNFGDGNMEINNDGTISYTETYCINLKQENENTFKVIEKLFNSFFEDIKINIYRFEEKKGDINSNRITREEDRKILFKDKDNWQLSVTEFFIEKIKEVKENKNRNSYLEMFREYKKYLNSKQNNNIQN